MSSIRINISRLRERINRACELASRKPESVRLLAVSKTKPAILVEHAIAAGQSDFGENYLQDALTKIDSFPDACWHFIGAIQSNKTRDIAAHFDWVHTVSSVKVARRLDAQRPDERKPLNVLIQVNINNEEGKAGVVEEHLLELVNSLIPLKRILLRGLMAIPQKSEDYTRQRTNFAHLAGLQKLVQQKCGLSHFDELSMGMSADLEAAIAEGATWVRIGTDIFGEREPL
jgi:pyridoxal phosphate enzyme (YggS family)